MTDRTDVHAYDLAWEYDEPLSVHVVETDGATVLFGGAVEERGGALVDFVHRHDVDVVVAEHGDWDHYAGLPDVRDATPEVAVAAPAGDVPVLSAAGIDVDVALETGETYWGVTVVGAPGHTPDNAAYVYEDVLVAGDTVVGADSTFAADDAWSGPLAVVEAAFNDDDARTRASVSNLLPYDVETVLVSHGRSVTSGGHAAIETLVEDLS